MHSKFALSHKNMYILAHIFSYITKTRLFKYIENFTAKKGKISDKKFWHFHIPAQDIDCGYL